MFQNNFDQIYTMRTKVFVDFSYKMAISRRVARSRLSLDFFKDVSFHVSFLVKFGNITGVKT